MNLLLNKIKEILITYYDNNNILYMVYDELEKINKTKGKLNLSFKGLDENIDFDINEVKELSNRLDQKIKKFKLDGDLVILRQNNPILDELLIDFDILNFFIYFYNLKNIEIKDLNKLIEIIYYIKKTYKKQNYPLTFVEQKEKLENLAYLDFGVIDNYEEFKNELEELKKNNQIKYVTSHIHAEELLKREMGKKVEKNFLKKFYNNLEILTDSLMVLPHGNKFKRNIVKENIRAVKKRCNYDNLIMTDILTFIYIKEFYKQFQNKLECIYDKINIRINSCNSLDDIINIEKNVFEKILTSIPLLKEENIAILKQQIQKNHIDYFLLDNTIYELTNFFNFIKYKSDTKNQKIMSSNSDRSHICMAANLKYLITTDSRLEKRATVIYNFLNINTKVILLKKNKIN